SIPPAIRIQLPDITDVSCSCLMMQLPFKANLIFNTSGDSNTATGYNRCILLFLSDDAVAF
ncbi:hypothetical protein, partial [Chitinophaga deserti]|uniref:hypothetical protein n=1 Tax=Chitinophaga deserti TaxID=2164099 RepID=UPI001E2BAF4F